MKIAVTIPTWNERENIGFLIEELYGQLSKIPHEMHILVVDDNSPDGTADVVRELQQRHSNLHLLQGQRTGLGAAYIRGMKYAVDVLKADAVLEMDADFSHSPADVPRLVKALDDGADFVIGSRYVAGGSIPKEWGVFRRLNSRYGNMVARYLVGIYNVRDCTSGFRAIRSVFLKQIILADIKVQGYAFLVAFLYEAVLRKATIKEVPINFIDRTKGESKLGISDIIEFIINAWWLRLRSAEVFIRYLIVGGSGVIVNLGLFTLFLRLGLNKYIASPAAIAISVISNFILNNIWTFSRRDNKSFEYIRGLKFNVVSVVLLSLNYAIFILISLLFPDSSPQSAQFAGVILATAFNYFFNSYWTFKAGTNHDIKI